MAFSQIGNSKHSSTNYILGRENIFLQALSISTTIIAVCNAKSIWSHYSIKYIKDKPELKQGLLISYKEIIIIIGHHTGDNSWLNVIAVLINHVRTLTKLFLNHLWWPYNRIKNLFMRQSCSFLIHLDISPVIMIIYWLLQVKQGTSLGKYISIEHLFMYTTADTKHSILRSEVSNKFQTEVVKRKHLLHTIYPWNCSRW